MRLHVLLARGFGEDLHVQQVEPGLHVRSLGQAVLFGGLRGKRHVHELLEQRVLLFLGRFGSGLAGDGLQERVEQLRVDLLAVDGNERRRGLFGRR